ncbi:MAG: sugar ABC transporter permease [Rhodospirillaceae bacterium]|jgi:multiple sugar transport system permease protein|nr:sugar ABC transporter permease [Rhodospirillaceae bacterium]MBT6404603.1 sugar ABC transporter permease [Rhodospirillaceae bacterium]MBT6535306.1 sugar ABC transporter permease [Rhodospirillaceae bacterium]
MTADATINTTPAPGSKRERTRAQGIRRFKWAVLTPFLALMLFILMPAFVLQGYFSFFAFSIFDAGDNTGFSSYFEASEWVGLDLWADALSDDKFGFAIIRSLLFATGVTVGCFILGFMLALLMYRPFRGQGVYYIFFILPMLTVPIVIAYTGEMILYQNGPLNDILSILTQTRVEAQFLYKQEVALTSIALLEIWNWTPFSFIIMMAGLASLPKEPQEAAQILGANKWRIFWEVQVPLLRPVILLALILRFLESMAEFPKTWGLLQGGPGSATETVPVYIFINAWQFFDISYGAVLSYLILFMMAAIVMSAIWLLRREKKSLDAMYDSKPQEG